MSADDSDRLVHVTARVYGITIASLIAFAIAVGGRGCSSYHARESHDIVECVKAGRSPADCGSVIR